MLWKATMVIFHVIGHNLAEYPRDGQKIITSKDVAVVIPLEAKPPKEFFNMIMQSMLYIYHIHISRHRYYNPQDGKQQKLWD